MTGKGRPNLHASRSDACAASVPVRAFENAAQKGSAPALPSHPASYAHSFRSYAHSQSPCAPSLHSLAPSARWLGLAFSSSWQAISSSWQITATHRPKKSGHPPGRQKKRGATRFFAARRPLFWGYRKDAGEGMPATPPLRPKKEKNAPQAPRFLPFLASVPASLITSARQHGGFGLVVWLGVGGGGFGLALSRRDAGGCAPDKLGCARLVPGGRLWLRPAIHLGAPVWQRGG